MFEVKFELEFGFGVLYMVSAGIFSMQSFIASNWCNSCILTFLLPKCFMMCAIKVVMVSSTPGVFY